MNNKITGDFEDLNKFRGLGEDPAYNVPKFPNPQRPRFWPLSKWTLAPQDLGYDPFPNVSWKGLRLLKDPEAQVAYHNLLWELKPKTIIELGVFSGGSLVWFRDLTRMFGIPDVQIIGIDKDLSRCQIGKEEMDGISLHQGDCNELVTLDFLKGLGLQHPILLIDDAHWNTFNVLKFAVNELLQENDYIVLEDMIPYWRKYSPNMLEKHMSAFDSVMKLDLLYSNIKGQLEGGVFKVTNKGQQN